MLALSVFKCWTCTFFLQNSDHGQIGILEWTGECSLKKNQIKGTADAAQEGFGQQSSASCYRSASDKRTGKSTYHPVGLQPHDQPQTLCLLSSVSIRAVGGHTAEPDMGLDETLM